MQFNDPGDIGRRAEVVTASTEALRELGPVKRVGEGGSLNTVVYLHGYGDGQGGMEGLAKGLRLPQTEAVVLRGVGEMPLGMDGRQWWVDSKVEETLWGGKVAGEMERKGRQRAVQLVLKFLDEELYKPGVTFLVGHGQGAELAMMVAAKRGVAGMLLIDPPHTQPPSLHRRGLPIHIRAPQPHPLTTRLTHATITTSSPTSHIVEVAKWFGGILPMSMPTLESDPDLIKVDQGVLQ